MTLFEGIILIDKPKGLTSHDVVHKVRKLLGTKRVGHAGTLDPLATGLLVILVERATRLSDYLLNGQKTYYVEGELGVSTDTFDADGEVVKTFNGDFPSKDQVLEAIRSLEGTHELKVPAYSAAKVDGKKLYEYARQGEAVPEVTKLMSFERLSSIEIEPRRFRLEITCSKGSFIRTFVNEVGERLGCGAHVTALRRLESAPYDVTQAVTLEQLEEALHQSYPPKLGAGVLSIEDALPQAPQVRLSGPEMRLMLSGQIPEGIQLKSNSVYKGANLLRLLDSSGALLAVLERTEIGAFRVGCVFPPQA